MFLIIFGRFPTIFRRFPKIFKMPKGRTNDCKQFPNISENVRRLPRTIRRCFDLISKNFGSLSTETWQTLRVDWSKIMCRYHFYPHVIPFLSICYHSLYHLSLYYKNHFYLQDISFWTRPIWLSILLKKWCTLILIFPSSRTQYTDSV